MPAQGNYIAVRRMSLASSIIKLILTVIIWLGVFCYILFTPILAGIIGDAFHNTAHINSESITAGYELFFWVVAVGGWFGSMIAELFYAIAGFWVLPLLIFIIVSTILGFVFLKRNKRYLEQWQQPQDQQDQTFYPYKYLKADAIVNLVISAFACCCIFSFGYSVLSFVFDFAFCVPFIAILILSVISLIRMKKDRPASQLL